MLADYTTYKIIDAAPTTFYHYSVSYAAIDYLSYIIITGLCAYYMIRGARIARIAYLIYVVGRISINYFTHTIAGANLITNLIIFLYICIQLVTLTLLFSPDSNKWFKHIQPTPTTSSINPQTQPRVISVGISMQILAFLAFITFHVTAYLYLQHQIRANAISPQNANSILMIIIHTLIAATITITLIIAVIKRTYWARAAWVVFTLVQITIQFYLHLKLKLPYLCTLSTYAYFIFTISGLTLFFLPNSNTWFENSKEPPEKKP